MVQIRLLDVGVAQRRGDRPEQQDRYHVIKPGEFHEEHVAVFGVYDGHAGTQAVSKVQDQLASVLEGHLDSNFDAVQYQTALRNALKEEDAALHKTGMALQGSTAAVGLLDTAKGLLVTADLGDSHIVLADGQPEADQQWQISRLSALQKPDSEMERQRIIDAGGEVKYQYGIARVGGLAMSRALGDSQLKQPHVGYMNEDAKSQNYRGDTGTQKDRRVTGNLVSNQAHVAAMELHGRSVLLLASDGIGEAFNAEDAARQAAEMHEQGVSAQKIADRLTKQAMRLPVPDNATVIIVVIDEAS